MKRDVAEALREAGVKRVMVDEPMARHTSWRIGGTADVLCVVDDAEQLQSAVRLAVQFGIPWVVLGGGNNVLVADDGIEGLVILNRLRGVAIEGDGNDAVLACGAGVFFARAAQYSAQRGYNGMEWGIAIPGTVGGGVVNNAGAHFSDVSSALVSAHVMDESGRTERVQPADLAYRYRQSSLKRSHLTQTRLVVTGCRFRITRGDAREALARVEELRQHRLRTQPVKEASAGSTFKNPPENHAGALIDRAGLKGHRIGGAVISPLHANFILNGGTATAGDVVKLIRIAQERVESQFGVHLQPEVQFVGRWNETLLQPITGLETQEVGRRR